MRPASAEPPFLPHLVMPAHHEVRSGDVLLRRLHGNIAAAADRGPQDFSQLLLTPGVGARTMGMDLSEGDGEVAATLIPSVGCPIGCNFCATSAMFGGKGQYTNFYETGDELFEVMVGLERDMKVQSFFVMDENFLLHRKRALRLLELQKQHNKSWSLYVFSSARVLNSYTTDQLVELGISWVWMGLEGKGSQYVKLGGIDTLDLVRLGSHAELFG